LSKNSEKNIGYIEMIKKAIILAAGKGTRLWPLTDSHPKPLTLVNNITILENCLNCLADLGIPKTVIVVGYKAQDIINQIGYKYKGIEIVYELNELYETTNNIYSLWLARFHFNMDCLLIEGDIFFDKELISRLFSQEQNRNYAVTSQFKESLEGTVVEINKNNRIKKFQNSIKLTNKQKLDRKIHKTVNIYLLTNSFLEKQFRNFIEKKISEGYIGLYYEELFGEMVKRKETEFWAVDCSDLRWVEIDNLNDLSVAEKIFSQNSQKLNIISQEHGGYWRYDFVDHCLLYNLYFPPQKFMRALTERMSDLVLNYPAGQKSITWFLAQYLQEDPKYLVIGNGVSEFIRIIANNLRGKMMIPTPSFNEYENSVATGQLIRFPLLPERNFELDMESFVNKALVEKPKLLIIVSPNNPTGNSIPRSQLIYLLEALRDHDIIIIIDESFVDFMSTPEQQSLTKYVTSFNNLVIVKSLSKTYGIGGIRLGYLLTSNLDFMALMRNKLPIWNINGFGEEFIRNLPSYQKEYKASCLTVRNNTDLLHQHLQAIPELKVFPTVTNYIFCHLANSIGTAKQMTEKLLIDHKILVKDCSGKSLTDSEQWLRIASRTPDENLKVVNSMKKIIEECSR